MLNQAKVSLASPIKIRTTMVKNRIVLPPMVVCGLHPDGAVSDAVVDHYERFARGGCGIIIQEATCVSPNGKLVGPQLGLWKDSQIMQHARVVDACRPYGALMLVQIHYASKEGEPDTVVQVGPSPYVNQDGPHRELTFSEIEQIRDDYIAAASRAEKAGYQGVELHGAHGYLLCAFMNPEINQRQDKYGQPTRLVREITEGIREITGADFIVAIRIGADNPGMADGIERSREIEKMDIDLLDVSSGIGRSQPLPVSAGFPFSELAWRGVEIKKQASLPVIAVGDLNDPALAKQLVSGGYADFAAIGRGMLVDSEWAGKALAGEEIIPCLDCQKCVWLRHHERCPGRKGIARQS